MSDHGEQWRREDCSIERLTERDAFRVLHRPSKTVRFVDAVRVEVELRRDIAMVPMAGTVQSRREAIAVRFAWEDARDA